jgi:hypothetical protein
MCSSTYWLPTGWRCGICGGFKVIWLCSLSKLLLNHCRVSAAPNLTLSSCILRGRLGMTSSWRKAIRDGERRRICQDEEFARRQIGHPVLWQKDHLGCVVRRRYNGFGLLIGHITKLPYMCSFCSFPNEPRAKSPCF